MSPPTVLVAIPLYNALSFIESSIRSILDQTFPDFQLLIINDGSTDGSETVARSLTDRRIVVCDQANAGIASVMNTALAFAREAEIPYLACMAADDLSAPERLEIQLDFMERQPAAAACGSNCHYIDSKTEQIIGSSTVPLSSQLIHWEVFHGLRGMIEGACVFRVDALHTVGGYRPYFLHAEDTDIFLRLAEKFELINVPHYLYKIRLHRDSLSVRNHRKNVFFHFYALDCSYRRRHGDPEIEPITFERTLSLAQKFSIWREMKFLELWRIHLFNGSRLALLAASLLSPLRPVSRVLRSVEKRNWLRKSANHRWR